MQAIALTLRPLALGRRDIRAATICEPHGRQWFAKTIERAPGLMRQSHPDLYADLDARPTRGNER